MSLARANAELALGLRALDALGGHAPLDPPGFAREAELELGDAARLLRAFEHEGYARRIPGSALFVLTPLALTIVTNVNPAGRLVSECLELVDQAERDLGVRVTMRIPAPPRQAGSGPAAQAMSIDHLTASACPTTLAAPVRVGDLVVAVLTVSAARPIGEARAGVIRARLEQVAGLMLGALRRPSLSRAGAAMVGREPGACRARLH